jgi:hypothetical protein
MAMRMAKNLGDYTYGSQTKASYGPTGSSGVIRQLGLIASVPWLGSYGRCCQKFMTNRFSKIFKTVQTRVQSRTEMEISIPLERMYRGVAVVLVYLLR